MEYTAKNGGTFRLGTVSNNWLDTGDVFDKYQQDNDYNSKCIFLNDGTGIEEFADDILARANENPKPSQFNQSKDRKLRTDIKDKLIKFSEFIRTSGGVKAFIL